MVMTSQVSLQGRHWSYLETSVIQNVGEWREWSDDVVTRSTKSNYNVGSARTATVRKEGYTKNYYTSLENTHAIKKETSRRSIPSPLPVLTLLVAFV
jgi:hypothetical protein